MNQNYTVNDNQYDEETRKRIQAARAQGYSEQSIKVLADRFAGGQAPKVAVSSGGGGIGGFAKSVFQPVINAGKVIGEGAFQTGRALVDPIWRKAVFQGVDKLTPEELKKLGGSKATQLLSPEEARAPTSYKDFMENQNVLKYGIKAGAGTLAFAVPGGSTLKSAALAGALSGGLTGLSQGEDFNLGRVATGAIVGGGTGLLFKGGEKAIGKGKEFLKSSKQALQEKAAANITKATPSSFDKAAEMGMDLNDIVKRRQLGVSYDDALGPISERGNGGLVGNQLKQAENVIKANMKAGSNLKVSGVDFVKALNQEKALLSKIPGNQDKIAALEEIIKETERMFKNGMSPNRLLVLKRAADSKFGRAVIEEQKGSVITSAQKIIANTSRAKLKRMFPAVADALDAESELLTIKPVLSMARSKAKTSGATLSTFDITRPGTFIDPFLKNPAIAGKVAGAAPSVEVAAPGAGSDFFNAAKSPVLNFAKEVPAIKAAGAIAGQIPGQVAATLPAIAGANVAGKFVGGTSTVQPPTETQVPDQGQIIADPNGQWKYDTTTKQITDNSGQWKWDEASQDWTPNAPTSTNNGLPTKEQLQTAMVQALNKGNSKQFNMLQDAYKSFYPAEKPFTGQQIKDSINAQSGLDNLKLMKDRLAKDPGVLIKAALPGALGARDYVRWGKEVSDVYTRLRTGAALNEQEMVFYDSQLPKLLDYNNPQNIASSLAIFENLFNKISNQKPGISDVVGNNFTFSTGEPPVVNP